MCVASLKFNDSSQLESKETILSSLQTFSECLSMDEFKSFDISRAVRLCSGIITIHEVRFSNENDIF